MRTAAHTLASVPVEILRNILEYLDWVYIERLMRMSGDRNLGMKLSLPRCLGTLRTKGHISKLALSLPSLTTLQITVNMTLNADIASYLPNTLTHITMGTVFSNFIWFQPMREHQMKSHQFMFLLQDNFHTPIAMKDRFPHLRVLRLSTEPKGQRIAAVSVRKVDYFPKPSSTSVEVHKKIELTWSSCMSYWWLANLPAGLQVLETAHVVNCEPLFWNILPESLTSLKYSFDPSTSTHYLDNIRTYNLGLIPAGIGHSLTELTWTHLTRNDLEIFARVLPNLQSISWSTLERTNFINWPRNLTSMIIHPYYRCIDLDQKLLVTFPATLQHFTNRNARLAMDAAMNAALPRGLITLILTRTCKTTSFSDLPPNLITYTTSISPALNQLPSLWLLPRSIKYLSISLGCKKADDISLHGIPPNLLLFRLKPTSSALTLSPPNNLEVLPRSLLTLTLPGFQIKDEELDMLPQGLTKLHLTGCCNITELNAEHLPKQLTSLKLDSFQLLGYSIPPTTTELNTATVTAAVAKILPKSITSPIYVNTLRFPFGKGVCVELSSVKYLPPSVTKLDLKNMRVDQSTSVLLANLVSELRSVSMYRPFQVPATYLHTIESQYKPVSVSLNPQLPALTSLTTDDDWESSIPVPPLLEILHVRSINLSLLSNCLSLHTLHVMNQDITSWNLLPKNLTSLTLAQNPYKCPNDVTHLGSLPPRLTSFSLPHCCLPDFALRSLPPAVTTITLQMIIITESMRLIEILNTNNNIDDQIKFSLGDLNKMSNDLPPSYLNLASPITTRARWRVCESDMMNIPLSSYHVSMLTALHLPKHRKVERNILKQLPRGLLSLVLNGSGLPVDSIEHLPKTLTYLNFKDLKALKPSVVKRLPQNLKYLTVTSYNVSPKIFILLPRSIVHLKLKYAIIPSSCRECLRSLPPNLRSLLVRRIFSDVQAVLALLPSSLIFLSPMTDFSTHVDAKFFEELRRLSRGIVDV